MEDLHELHVRCNHAFVNHPIVLAAITIYRRLALLILLPAIQIVFVTGSVGGNVRDVKLLYTNNDNCKYLISCCQF